MWKETSFGETQVQQHLPGVRCVSEVASLMHMMVAGTGGPSAGAGAAGVWPETRRGAGRAAQGSSATPYSTFHRMAAVHVLLRTCDSQCSKFKRRFDEQA